MTPQERKITFSLAAIYSFRMLGLFMILPVFSLYTTKLAHATPVLIGVALGIYGLTQAILQIPFGMCSDRLGRKPIILLGLILFVIGSVVAALSHSIYGIIAGRALQGAGAVGSVLVALLADTTAEENRLKAMSLIGTTIGFSFILAMMLGPLINNFYGLSGIFWLTAVLALLGIFILYTIPVPKTHTLHRDSEPVLNQLGKTFRMPELLRLNFGIFSLHGMLMALFIVIPLTLISSTGLAEKDHWMIYVPVLILSAIGMIPFIIIAEAKRKIKAVFVGAILTLTISDFLFEFFHYSTFGISVLLWLFFTAFTLLEGILPSLISKTAPAGSKGTAMGIYSSSQFLGIFCGASIGGYIFNHYGINATFTFCGILGTLWTIVALTMKKPLHLSSKILSVGKLTLAEAAALQAKLLATKGVYEAVIVPEEGVAYLKVDRKEVGEKDLQKYC